MKGLCSPQPLIRQKFFGLLNTHIRKRLYDRIMYIVCEQNWETIGNHYWIGQCIELLLSVSDCDASLKSPNVFAKLPLPTSFVATVTGQFGDKYSCPIPGNLAIIMKNFVFICLLLLQVLLVPWAWILLVPQTKMLLTTTSLEHQVLLSRIEIWDLPMLI